MTKRNIIIHYHMFKNAGSSVDTILQHNFGDKWVEIEGENNKKLRPEEMEKFIRENPHIEAISSHTAVVRLPQVEGVDVTPIFLIRHPIDRIKSAYEFEKRQTPVNTEGARVAKEGDFTHYMNWRLTSPGISQVANFHAIRLKDFEKDVPLRNSHLFRTEAMKALEKLPVVGLVEKFDASMSRYMEIIKPKFPNFEMISAKSNSLRDPSLELPKKLQAFEDEVGREIFVRLMQLNAVDMELYTHVKSKYN